MDNMLKHEWQLDSKLPYFSILGGIYHPKRKKKKKMLVPMIISI
jgi:hypothetical protein